MEGFQYIPEQSSTRFRRTASEGRPYRDFASRAA